jgi:hypothetical protein
LEIRTEKEIGRRRKKGDALVTLVITALIILTVLFVISLMVSA